MSCSYVVGGGGNRHFCSQGPAVVRPVLATGGFARRHNDTLSDSSPCVRPCPARGTCRCSLGHNVTFWVRRARMVYVLRAYVCPCRWPRLRAQVCGERRLTVRVRDWRLTICAGTRISPHALPTEMGIAGIWMMQEFQLASRSEAGDLVNLAMQAVTWSEP